MTDDRTLRIALAGGGAFGAKHAAALRRIEGVEVTAVVSSSLERAQKFAAEQGVGRAVASLDEVLAMDDIDAVILATPPRCTRRRPWPASTRASTCRPRSRSPTPSATPRRA